MKPTLSDVAEVSSSPIMATPRSFDDAAVLTQATPSRLNDFYELTKPRMNFLVVITTMIGYYMAGGDTSNWVLILSTLVGTTLTASSAGTLNQFIERDIDRLMPRTRNRPLPSGRLQPIEALLFGIFLGISGVAILTFLVNPLTALLGAITVVTYLAIYTPMKRISSLNTVIGAVPGAIPPMMGCTAVHNAMSVDAIALFAILFIWQMPHFLGLAIMYKNDYAAGGFKMLPCVDNEELDSTVRQILLYGLALVPVSLVPSLIGMAGPAYFTAAVLLGLAFFSFGVSVAVTRSRIDAKKLFFASIIYLPLLLGAMLLDRM